MKTKRPKNLKGHRKVLPDGREVHIAVSTDGLVHLRFVIMQGASRVETELCLSNDGAATLLGLLMFYAAEGKIKPAAKEAKP